MSWIFLLFLLGALGQLIYYSLVYGITPTPTSSKVKNKIFENLPAEFEGKIIELGSGWGSLAIPLARKYPNCQIVAYEISPLPYFFSKFVAKFLGCKNLLIIRQDFFKVSLGDVALVVCYLYPGAMSRLKEKFEKELPAGAYVLSHTFAVPGWKPLQIEQASDLYHTPIYLYRISVSFN